MQKVPFTAGGMKKIRAELEHLKKEARPKVIDAIAEARAHGDLKENAEYHAAKEQQSFIEGRIRYLDQIISAAQIIDVTTIPNEGRVIFGVTVDIKHLESEELSQYTIVGHEEADISDHKLSVNSPLARAMIGHDVGEEVMVSTPEKGEAYYEILKVEHLGDQA